jgi:hypothetical protein
MPPGTPDSIQPPAVPADLASRRIHWKEYWRMGTLVSVMAGLSVAFFGPLGTVLAQGLVAIAVSRYRRTRHAGLFASAGAKLGALTGLFSFIVYVILRGISVAADPSKFRDQIVLTIEQRLGSDPATQQLAHWILNNFAASVSLSLLLALILTLIVSAITGAVTIVFSGNKQRR